jgi:hypothetical protein
MRTTVIAFAAVALITSIAHAEPRARDAVEGVLTRLTLERAAFRACALHEGDKEAAGALTRAWRLDLTESWDVLRKAGYSEDDVRAYIDRFDLDRATPAFATADAFATFCATVGDWRKRFALMLGVLPQIELRKLLKQ